MRRTVAFMLAQAMAASMATGAALHVHDYAGHDHPEHHHGPATHDHDHPATADPDHHARAVDDDHAAWREAPCEPGRHAVTVSVASACLTHAHVEFSELPGPALAAARPLIRSAVRFTDVRVHGPPFDAWTPSRAPPLNPHA